MVLTAIGQRFEAGALGSEPSAVPALEAGRIRVDPRQATSLPGVYAGGDCTAGPDLTVQAVQDGKVAALAIDAALRAAAGAA